MNKQEIRLWGGIIIAIAAVIGFLYWLSAPEANERAGWSKGPENARVTLV